MKLLIISNPMSPGTDYYRTVGPFVQLAKDYPKVLTLDIKSPDSVLWFDIYNCDAVLFQRPNGGTLLGYIQEAKRMGKKILFDIDDLLHDIPGSNPAKAHFEQVKDTITQALEYCDHLFVSTPPLWRYYTNFLPPERVTMVRNAWNPFDHPFQDVEQETKPFRMLWRGSATHMSDLHTIKGALRVMLKDDAFTSVFCGLEEWMAFDLPRGNVQFLKWQTLFNYFKLMRESRPHYGFFPLVRDEFNLCKSNIFAIECLAAGALPIVPAGFPEFEIPGLLGYRSKEDFIQLLNDIKAGRIDRRQRIADARAWLEKNLHLCTLNEARLKVLQNLEL